MLSPVPLLADPAITSKDNAARREIGQQEIAAIYRKHQCNRSD